MTPFDPAQLAQTFDAPSVDALALMGSYARDDAGPFSDVDLVRLIAEQVEPPDGSGSHIINGRLVVVSNVRPAQVVAWFERPDQAVEVIAGLRAARPLVDRAGIFAAIQRRAHAFVWDATMQTRANVWASEQLVGWSEEAHKGLEGLRRDDIGRLLNARFGLSWGLSRVMQVQRGVLLTSDNTFWDQVALAVGSESVWTRLRHLAFGLSDYGVAPPTLREQVIGGLRLYIVTAELLAPAIQSADAPLIAHTVALIKQELGPLPLSIR